MFLWACYCHKHFNEKKKLLFCEIICSFLTVSCAKTGEKIIKSLQINYRGNQRSYKQRAQMVFLSPRCFHYWHKKQQHLLFYILSFESMPSIQNMIKMSWFTTRGKKPFTLDKVTGKQLIDTNFNNATETRKAWPFIIYQQTLCWLVNKYTESSSQMITAAAAGHPAVSPIRP